MLSKNELTVAQVGDSRKTRKRMEVGRGERYLSPYIAPGIKITEQGSDKVSIHYHTTADKEAEYRIPCKLYADYITTRFSDFLFQQNTAMAGTISTGKLTWKPKLILCIIKAPPPQQQIC